MHLMYQDTDSIHIGPTNGRRPLYNPPVLRISKRGSSFVPATGMCSAQARRLVPRLMLVPIYGKFGR